MDPIELLIRLARRILWNEPLDEQEVATKERNEQLFRDALNGAMRLIKSYPDYYIKAIRNGQAYDDDTKRIEFFRIYKHMPSVPLDVLEQSYPGEATFPREPTATILDVISRIFGPRRIDEKTGQTIVEPAKLTAYAKEIINTQALIDLDRQANLRGLVWGPAINARVFTSEEQAIRELFRVIFGKDPTETDWETTIVPALTDNKINPASFGEGSTFSNTAYTNALLFHNLWNDGQPTNRDKQSYFNAYYSAVTAYALATGVDAQPLLDNQMLLAQFTANYEKVSAVNRQLIRGGQGHISITFEEYLASALSEFAPVIKGKLQTTVGVPAEGSSAGFLDRAEAARRESLDKINESNAATKGISAYLATLGLDAKDIKTSLEVFAPTLGFSKSPWSGSEGLNAYRQRIFDYVTNLQKGLEAGGTRRDMGELFTNLSIAGAFMPEFNAPFVTGKIDPSVAYTWAQEGYQQAGLPTLDIEQVELLHQQANAMEIRQAKEAVFGVPSSAIESKIMAFASTLPIEEQASAIKALSRELMSLYQAERARGLASPGAEAPIPGRQRIDFPTDLATLSAADRAKSERFQQEQTQSALAATGAEARLTGTELTTAAQKQGITTTSGPGFAQAFTFELFAGSQNLSELYQKVRPKEQIQRLSQPQRGSFLPIVRV